MAVLDAFLLEHTPGPTIELHPAVLEARAALARATSDLLAIPDGAALEREWSWSGPPGESDVRYGFYRILEAFEAAAHAATRTLDEAGIQRAPASRLAAAATQARWDLHGLLASLSDDEFDADPGGGEWTVRQTLAHIISAQRAYAWFTAWWLSRRDAPDFPERVPDDAVPGFPDESTEAPGSLADVRARLDAILDLGAGRLGGLDDDGLAARARWSGFPVDVGFRLARWSSHLQEHTVQVEKTLGFIGRELREVERLVRLVHRAYGRLEATVFALPPAALETGGAASAAGRLNEAAAEAVRVAGEVRQIATRG